MRVKRREGERVKMRERKSEKQTERVKRIRRESE